MPAVDEGRVTRTLKLAVFMTVISLCGCQPNDAGQRSAATAGITLPNAEANGLEVHTDNWDLEIQPDGSGVVLRESGAPGEGAGLPPGTFDYKAVATRLAHGIPTGDPAQRPSTAPESNLTVMEIPYSGMGIFFVLPGGGGMHGRPCADPKYALSLFDIAYKAVNPAPDSIFAQSWARFPPSESIGASY
jgi:hypothetical protein